MTVMRHCLGPYRPKRLYLHELAEISEFGVLGKPQCLEKHKSSSPRQEFLSGKTDSRLNARAVGFGTIDSLAF